MATWIKTRIDDDFWGGWDRVVKQDENEPNRRCAIYGDSGISTMDPNMPVDQGWICPETGSQLALVNDGNWRWPNDSKFKLLLRTGSGEIRDVSSIIYGIDKFDSSEDGASTYDDVFNRCVAHVDSLLR